MATNQTEPETPAGYDFGAMMRKDQEETRNMQRWLDENDHEYRFTVDSLRKKNPALGQGLPGEPA